jgi:hypothetical protein
MALSILDGNQSATTLSTIVTSGQHIPAHTVVSLGTQAISNITSAVSGTAVTFGLVGGTVTANNFTLTNVLQYDGSHYFLKVGGVATTGGTSFPVYVAGSVTVGNSVTIGSLPTISGTVTAMAGNNFRTAIEEGILDFLTNDNFPVNIISPLPAGTNPLGSVTASISGTVPVSGTFFQATQPVSLATVPTHGVTLASTTVTVSSLPAISGTVTIGSLPAISGTVTANTFALQGTAVTTSNFTSITPSTVLASFNATREVLTIFNEGAGNLHLCAGATCTTIAYQVRLSAGDYYEVPNHQTTITHSAVFATAGTARVTEVS